jgi:hypothetical protein
MGACANCGHGIAQHEGIWSIKDKWEPIAEILELLIDEGDDLGDGRYKARCEGGRCKCTEWAEQPVESDLDEVA